LVFVLSIEKSCIHSCQRLTLIKTNDMKTKHTKSPWKVVERTTNGTKGFEVTYGSDGELITDHVYEESDAKLIAAAPDLLEAAINLTEDLSCEESFWELVEAIQKATS